jgi:hypothetical protein
MAESGEAKWGRRTMDQRVGNREYCDQDWLWGFWLVPVEDIVGELWGNVMRGTGARRGERGITRLEAAIQRKGRIVAVWAWGEEVGGGGGYIYEMGPGGSECRWVVRSHGVDDK